MGVDARWICHTCKTMCFADGARSVIKSDAKVEDIEKFLLLAPKIIDGWYVGGWEYLVRISESFIEWARRHNDHDIAISNDHSVSKDDLPDYRSETVDGKIGEKTFEEEMDAEVEYYNKNYCRCCGQKLPEEMTSE